MSLARFGSGQFFGEISLLRGGKAVASVRAAGSVPVELYLLPQDDLHQLLRGSSPTQDMVARVAHMRLAENQAHREGL